jgi:hypothetical protein
MATKDAEASRPASGIGRLLVQRIAARALEGNQACAELMEVFAVGSRKTGNGDIIAAYREEMRRRKRILVAASVLEVEKAGAAS